MPFSKILQVSSNIGFTKVAEKLKRERYFKYIEKFGFGQVTGIDVPGEVPGLLRKPESWSAIDLATHAFGQGISATPMQMVMAYAAIANGGFLMRPYLVRRVVGSKGEVLLENQPHVVRRVVSEKTSRLLASMLKEVTNEGGTGTMAKVEGFEVAGKTGTAQKADLTHGGYAAKRVGSFVGFVPAMLPNWLLWSSSMSRKSMSTAASLPLRFSATSRAGRFVTWQWLRKSQTWFRPRLAKPNFPSGKF